MVAIVTAYASSSRLQLISSDDVDYLLSAGSFISRARILFLYQLSREKLPKYINILFSRI